MSYSPRFLSVDSEGRCKAAYEFDEALEIAVNVALVTYRPLLITGQPGTGKTAVAKAVSDILGWRYYSKVITSRTSFTDLSYEFDSIQRLQDAQSREPDLTAWRYLRPGVFWWAFDPSGAPTVGQDPSEFRERCEWEPYGDPASERDTKDAVILLDEIDKADPDLPNNLLVQLDELRFEVPQARGLEVKAGRAPLMFITTNGERHLPSAFIRRCVFVSLRQPDDGKLRRIARMHFPLKRFPTVTDDLLNQVLDRMGQLAIESRKRRLRPPSTAEYLDAVRACAELGVETNQEPWLAIVNASLWKDESPVPLGT